MFSQQMNLLLFQDRYFVMKAAWTNQHQPEILTCLLWFWFFSEVEGSFLTYMFLLYSLRGLDIGALPKSGVTSQCPLRQHLASICICYEHGKSLNIGITLQSEPGLVVCSNVFIAHKDQCERAQAEKKSNPQRERTHIPQSSLAVVTCQTIPIALAQPNALDCFSY